MAGPIEIAIRGFIFVSISISIWGHKVRGHNVRGHNSRSVGSGNAPCGVRGVVIDDEDFGAGKKHLEGAAEA
jgi:hypothetical protein